MLSGIIEIIIAIIFIFIGISNLKGNVSLLHSYHVKNVSDEDKPKLGKLIGIAILIISLSLIISGVFMVFAELKNNTAFGVVSEISIGVGLLIGCAICLFAIKKYNKSIF